MDTRLGEVVRTLREQAGIDQAELAARASDHLPEGQQISQGRISEIERGKWLNPSREKVRAIADALGIAYNSLLERAGWIDPLPATTEVPSAAEEVLKIVALYDPRVLRELEEMRDENDEETYGNARTVVAKFFALGVEAAKTMVDGGPIPAAPRNR